MDRSPGILPGWHPHDWRITNSVGSVTDLGTSSPAISASSISVARLPCSYIGCRIVVSGGKRIWLPPVVKSHHAYILRHVQAAFPESIHRTYRHLIIGRCDCLEFDFPFIHQQADRFRACRAKIIARNYQLGLKGMACSARVLTYVSYRCSASGLVSGPRRKQSGGNDVPR